MASSALDDLVALLRELRDPAASVLSRANVARELFQLVTGLQPLERRELMVGVASRAAPDLAERLTESTGVDVTSEQLTTLAAALDQLDPDDVDALVDRLTDPAQRRDVAGSALRASGGALAEVAGIHVDGAHPDPLPAAEPEEPGQGEPELEPERSEPPVQEEMVEEPRGEAEDPQADAGEPRHAPTGSGIAETWVVGETAHEPDVEEPSPGTDRAVTAPEPDGERSWFTGRPLGIAAVDTPVSERIAQATSAGAALRAFRGLLHEVVELPGEARAETLRAIPDGWARRRALETLVRAGAVTREDIPVLLRSLSGRWQRTWVVGTLLQEDVIDVDQLDELVDAETAGRLRHRAELADG